LACFQRDFLFAAARAENRRLKSSFVDFWAAPPPRRFWRDLLTSKFWSSKQRVLPLFLGLLAQNGRIEQKSLKRNAVTKNAF
jgi:hypothetical protein